MRSFQSFLGKLFVIVSMLAASVVSAQTVPNLAGTWVIEVVNIDMRDAYRSPLGFLNYPITVTMPSPTVTTISGGTQYTSRAVLNAERGSYVELVYTTGSDDLIRGHVYLSLPPSTRYSKEEFDGTFDAFAANSLISNPRARLNGPMIVRREINDRAIHGGSGWVILSRQ